MNTAFIYFGCILFGIIVGVSASRFDLWIEAFFMKRKQPKPWKPKAYINKNNKNHK